MVPLILLLTAVIFQATTHWSARGDEFIRNPLNDETFDLTSRLTKRYIAALAKNKQLPIQERSYPPMVSPYSLLQKAYTDEGELLEDKRYLGALARSGDLNFSKPQQKRNTGELESEESDEYIQNKGYSEEQPNLMILKLELIDSLKPIILQYISEMKKDYDPKKVNLFLENLSNAVFDRNEEFTLDNIKSLVQTDYFQPEEKEVQKRNIQSLVRDYNVSFGGTHHHEPQSRQIRNPQYHNRQYDLVKRNLESLIKNKLYKRYVGAMAKNYDFPVKPPGKRYYDNFSADLEEYLKSLQAKRHTMYDINEPDLTVEYPSQAGDQSDYTDYADQMGQDAAIPIGKRYLGLPHHVPGWLSTPETKKLPSGPHRKS